MSKLLLAFMATMLLSALYLQQRSLPARPGNSYSGRVLSEQQGESLYLDIGPCGGTIILFGKGYSKIKTSVRVTCNNQQVDIYRVTQ